MRGGLTSAVVVGATLVVAGAASAAPVLYLTGRGTTVRTSTDHGGTWSTFATVTGGQFRGIDTDGTTVFVNNLNGGTGDTARPLLAYSAAGTLLDTALYNKSGSFNEQPVGAFGGYVYASTGGTPQNASTSWNGSTFGNNPLVNSGLASWQGNNITFATAGATSYIYTTGTSGGAMQRNPLNGNGTLGAATTVTTSGGPADLRDVAFTASGRLLTIGATGIFLSGVNQATSSSISLASAVSFSATESAVAGDMGANARDFALVGSDLYAVTDTRVFRYTLDDVAGTLSFVSAGLHGLSSNGVQIAGAVVPEPASVSALALGGIGLMARRRQSK